MTDKSRVLPLVLSSLVVTLSVALVVFGVQNRQLSKSNRELLASRAKLETKAQKLWIKNRTLFRALVQNSALVKNTDGQRKSLQDMIATLKKQDEEIQYEMKKSEAQMNSALEEKTYLEDILIHKTREIESLKKQTPPPTPTTSSAAGITDDATATSDISAKIKEKEDEIHRLTEQNHALSAKMDRLYQVTNSKISEINVAKIALEETVSGAKDKINEEWNTVNLGSISVDKNKNSESNSTQSPLRSGPKTAGKVLAINEDHGFVVVDLGKVDNLNLNANLEIFHDGKSIASLSVLEIRDVMTACNIKNLENGQKIQINDIVRIQK